MFLLLLLGVNWATVHKKSIYKYILKVFESLKQNLN